MEMFLLLLSGIAWLIVYIGCIRHGFRDKTYAMPLFALGLNIAWETIYTIHDLFRPSCKVFCGKSIRISF